MVFTEEDAANDGLIKDESRTQLKTIASRENPEISQYFREVCEELGIDPGLMLADMAVRALNDEAYAQEVASTEISLRQAKINDIREDDLELVQNIQERFSNGDTEESTVEKLIQQRLQQKVSGPFARAQSSNGGGSNRAEQQMVQQMQQMNQQMQQMQERINQVEGGEDVDEPTTGEQKTASERAEEVEGLFDSDEGEETATEEPEPDVEDSPEGTEDAELEVEDLEQEDEEMNTELTPEFIATEQTNEEDDVSG